MPWFIKEADKNWGRSVQCCQRPSEIIGLADPGCRFVVQQHVPDPLLTTDGHKIHLKFYILLVCAEDGTHWQLHTYKESYPSISPTRWSPEDISAETQVTIIRHPERTSETGCWPHCARRPWD